MNALEPCFYFAVLSSGIINIITFSALEPQVDIKYRSR